MVDIERSNRNHIVLVKSPLSGMLALHCTSLLVADRHKPLAVVLNVGFLVVPFHLEIGRLVDTMSLD